MQVRFLIGLTACVAVVGLPLLPQAQAQMVEQIAQMGQPVPDASPPALPTTPQNTSTPTPASTSPARNNFEGRGVAHGAAFTRGRNANVSLELNRDSFRFVLAEPPGNRARVQYRGTIVRQNTTPGAAGSFILDGRVQSADSSASNRVLNNTTGTCRIEVFAGRVISSNCRTATADTSTEFLGLERF